jgi:DNA topoisomerase-1
MVAFGHALPAIRSQVERDIGQPGLPRDKVLATVVRLLESTCIRIGNEEYARKNHSFGLTTLRSRHVKVAGSMLRFQFRSKGGKLYSVGLADRRLARVLRRCQELPGYELFQYLDESGQRQTVTSSDVNDYLRRVAGQDFTAKDFRTWAGTVAAARELRPLTSRSDRRRVTEAIARVAQQLGNTPAICRRCYIHPAIIEAHGSGSLARAFEAPPRRRPARGLDQDERVVLRILEGPGARARRLLGRS